MKYVVITLPPLLFFALVLVAGEVLTAPRAEFADTPAQESAPPPLAVMDPPVDEPMAHDTLPPAHVAAAQFAAVQQGPDALVPPHLAAALKAVAPDISLCVPQSLERDRGPVDIDVRFTLAPGGAFAPGTQVTTSWDDPEVAACVAEVFEETTFWPSGRERYETSEFVFHFPDDAMSGLLGLTYSQFY